MCIDAVCTSNALLLNFTMQFNRFYIRATNSTKRSEIQPINSLQEQRIEHFDWNESLDNTYVPSNILKLHRICNDGYDNVKSINIWKKRKNVMPQSNWAPIQLAHIWIPWQMALHKCMNRHSNPCSYENYSEWSRWIIFYTYGIYNGYIGNILNQKCAAPLVLVWIVTSFRKKNLYIYKYYFSLFSPKKPAWMQENENGFFHSISENLEAI